MRRHGFVPISSTMRMHPTQARWRHWQWRQGPLDWRERLVLIVLAIAAVPILLILFTALFLFAVGFGTIALAGWLVASLLRSRHRQPPVGSTISTDYVRLSEEQDRQAPRNPWTEA